MTKSEFDQYADEYESQHKSNIAITGEDPEYFSQYKIADAKKICDKYGVNPEVILDFGAGIGNSTPHFKRIFPQSTLISADVSNKSLDILQERYPDYSQNVFIEGNRIPLDDDSVDLAFTACVFHHIPESEHTHWLSEIRRVTRPGGIFVLFEHNPYNPLTVRAVNTCPFDENAVLIKAPDMTSRFESSGWKNISTRYRIFFPRPLAALRGLEPMLTWLPLGGQYSLVTRG